MTTVVTRESALAAAKLYKHALEGSPSAQFKVYESISQGDFPSQIAPTIRRTLLAKYNEQPSVVDRYTTRVLVERIGVDEEYNTYGFNQDNIPGVNMGDDFIPGTLPRVANRESYPQLGIQASGKKLRAEQFGEGFGIDWQAIVNSRGSQVNLIDDAITAFGVHARQLEDATPVTKLVSKAGIRTADLNAAGAKVIPNNPKIGSILDIQAAVALAQTSTIDGVPAYFQRFALLTAPANVPLVKQALTSTTIVSVPGSAARGTQYQQAIDLGADIDVVGVSWITAINPALTSAFFLIPLGGQRPVLTRNYLRGYEAPGFWVKDSNARNYNGGDVPFLDGDFDSDGIATKVRHVFGSNIMWGQGIVYSDGTGASAAA